MNTFDYALVNRDRIWRLVESKEFQDAWKELGYRIDFKLFQPTTEDQEPFYSKQTADWLDALRKKGLRKSKKTELRRKFVENVLVEWRAYSNLICALTYKATVWSLLSIIRSSKSKAEQQRAAISLLEVDLLFSSELGVSKIIAEGKNSRDEQFLMKYSRSINPKRKTKAFVSKRHDYALRVLSCLGFKDKPLPVWSEFIQEYNSQVEGQQNVPANWPGLMTFEQTENLRRAISRLCISKSYSKIGRPRN